MNTEQKTYNGWKNRQTWNIALWIGNDEGLYRSAVAFMERYKGRRPTSTSYNPKGSPRNARQTILHLSAREYVGVN